MYVNLFKHIMLVYYYYLFFLEQQIHKLRYEIQLSNMKIHCHVILEPTEGELWQSAKYLNAEKIQSLTQLTHWCSKLV